MKICIFYADPPNPNGHKSIRVDVEARELRDWVQHSLGDSRVQIFVNPATRLDDLLHQINRTRPDIVHFSCHGNLEGVLLEDGSGSGGRMLSTDDLVDLMEAAPDTVKLVVLNSCFSADQATRVGAVVGCAIGTTEAVPDVSAIEFSKAFYGALANGLSVEKAFAQGRLKARIDGAGAPFELATDGKVRATELVLLPLVGR